VSFASFQDFLAMGGHGLYVWLSYAAALIIILYNVISARLALRRFIQDARARERRHGSAPRAAADVATGETSR
jgi:heme exporter protein D